MKSLPTRDSVKGTPFTAADLAEAGKDRLRLTVVAGAKFAGRRVAEPLVNRLGLALTGFFECFAYRRLQLVGNAEWAYLESLPRERRDACFAAVLERNAKFFVFAAGHHAPEQFLALAEKHGAVVMETPLKTRVFSRLVTFEMENLGAPRTALYGTMVEVCGLGILFEGDPGLGKSETALGLIKRGHALVADDLTCIRKDVANNRLVASASESTAGYMEIRGIGIMNVRSIFGINSVRGEKRLQLVVTLKRLGDMKGEVDRIGQTLRMRTILGVSVPNVIIPVSEGRDLVNLVETAAQQYKIVSSGTNPAAELSERLRRRAARPIQLKRRESNGR